jgi:chemotaxis protein methyltransferase CheR
LPTEVSDLAHSPQGEGSISPAAEQTEAANNEHFLWKEGLALFEQGNYGEAVRKLKAGCRQLHPPPDISVLLARACANSGELAEAREWAAKAISADKLNPALHYLLAVILQEQGAAEDGVASLQRALYLDPHFVLAHYALGNHKLQQRKFKAAGKHFTNALALLAGYQRDAVLPHSDGLAAGRLRELIESTKLVEQAA